MSFTWLRTAASTGKSSIRGLQDRRIH
jgi:hypothetical protein